MALEGNSSAHTGVLMEGIRNKACGLDIHKKFIVACIKDLQGVTLEARYDRTPKDLLRLKEWIVENNCEIVACESTSDFWVLVYEMLEGHIELIVGNARDIKAISHKKTDKVDAAWIATLSLHDLIPRSRIPDKEARELRSLIRLRKNLVEKRTDMKNQVHHILDSCLFRLSSLLSDIFGKSGMLIMNGVINGIPVEEIISVLPERIRRRSDEIKGILETNLPQTAMFRLKCCLDLIRDLDDQIGVIMQMVNRLVSANTRIIRLLTSVPGVGYLAAVTLIAEIGDFKDFSSGDKLASWLGLVPTVKQSADYLRTGAITKRGSKVVRWILVQCAQAAARSHNTRFADFFKRKVGSIGFNKTIVAIARKMVTIIWHLVINDEIYEEKGRFIPREIQIPASKEPRYFNLNQILELVASANIFLAQPDPHVDSG
jgi:transposase